MKPFFMSSCFQISLFFILLFFSGLFSYGQSNGLGKTNEIVRDTLRRDTLMIDTVSIHRELLSADSMYRLKQKEHRTIYLWGDNKKPVTINPFGGIAININKLYSHFSKKGKQSRRLQKVFDSELNADLVNGIWKPYTVKYTGLKGDSLFVFQTYFQPEYKSFRDGTHYEKLYYIIQSMRAYRESTEKIHGTMRLPKLNSK